MIVKGELDIERRAADLSRLPAAHPMQPLILQCLQDDPAQRLRCREMIHILLASSVPAAAAVNLHVCECRECISNSCSFTFFSK